MPIFPFHTWLPDAHVEAPTAGSVMLAGVLLKMGGYGLLRLCVTLLPQAAHDWQWLLIILAVVNSIYGAFVALAQTDLKKMIANSSISHMGYVILGIAALTQVGFNGALLVMVAHGLYSGLLFSMVGLVYDRTHTREIGMMGGLAARMPFIATVFIIAGLASLGLPGPGRLRGRVHDVYRRLLGLPAGDHPVRVHDRHYRGLHPVAAGLGVLRPAASRSGRRWAMRSGASASRSGMLAAATLLDRRRARSSSPICRPAAWRRSPPPLQSGRSALDADLSGVPLPTVTPQDLVARADAAGARAGRDRDRASSCCSST